MQNFNLERVILFVHSCHFVLCVEYNNYIKCAIINIEKSFIVKPYYLVEGTRSDNRLWSRPISVLTYAGLWTNSDVDIVSWSE